MAGAAPVYDFKYNYNDYLDQAKGQLNPQYDTQVANQQASIPLIQQQYKALADAITQNQADTTNTVNKNAVNSIGSNRLKNAAMGIFDSSEDTANAHNVMNSTNDTLSSLAKTVANQLSQNNTEEQGKELTVKQAIDAINSERNNSIQNLAGSLLAAAQNAYDKKFGADSQNYWSEVTNEAEAQRAKDQHDMDMLNYNLNLSQFNHQKDMDALTKSGFDPSATSTVQTQVFYDENGKPKDQNAVYRDLMQNGAYYRSIGADVDSLWNAWRNLAYGAKYGYNKSQDEYNSLSKAAAASKSNNSSSNYTIKSLMQPIVPVKDTRPGWLQNALKGY